MDRLDPPIFSRITQAILSLETNPRPLNCKKLRDREEYSLRVGAYRVLYTINDKTRGVEIVAAGHP